MSRPVEMSRVRQMEGIDGRQYWVVQIFSAAAGCWIMHSESTSEAGARAELAELRKEQAA